MPYITIYPYDEIQEYQEELKRLHVVEEDNKKEAEKERNVRLGLALKKLAEEARKYVFAEFRKQLKITRSSRRHLLQNSEFT